MPASVDPGLDDLIEPRPPPCLTIHIPFVPADAGGRQARIRWRNLLRRSEAALRAAGADPGSLLEPLQELDPLAAAGSARAEGLAVFRAAGLLRVEPLHEPPAEGVTAGPRFELRPLLRERAGPARFFVLALSRHRVRLIEATAQSAGEIEVPGLPRTIEEALSQETPERILQSHGPGPGVAGQRGSVFHGQGASADAHEDEQSRFCRRVDAAIHAALGDARSPLILACVEELHPAYARVSTHPGLLPDYLRGNPDRLRDAELAARAREALQAVRGRAERDAVERFRALAGTGKTCASVEETVPATLDGRVVVLFVDAEARRWGSWDPARRAVTLSDRPGPSDQDLVERAATEALRRGGTVFVLPAERMPVPSPLAALLRY
jgi:hypothetical protein